MRSPGRRGVGPWIGTARVSQGFSAALFSTRRPQLGSFHCWFVAPLQSWMPGVWMHLDIDGRRRATARITTLLIPGSRFFANLATDGPQGRRMFDVSAADTAELTAGQGLGLRVHHQALQQVRFLLAIRTPARLAPPPLSSRRRPMSYEPLGQLSAVGQRGGARGTAARSSSGSAATPRHDSGRGTGHRRPRSVPSSAETVGPNDAVRRQECGGAAATGAGQFCATTRTLLTWLSAASGMTMPASTPVRR